MTARTFSPREMEALEVLAGMRGRKDGHAVRFRDLTDYQKGIRAAAAGAAAAAAAAEEAAIVAGEAGNLADAAQQGASDAAEAAAEALTIAQGAKAGFDGLADFAAFKADAGGVVSLIELFALSNPVLQMTLARIAADQIILDGSVGTEMLAVGLGRNLGVNTNFAQGLRHWNIFSSGAVGAQSAVSIRPPGETWAGVSYPTMMLFQNGTETVGLIQAHMRPVSAASGTEGLGIPVEAGKWYEFSARVSTHRCTGTVRIAWVDAAGNFISDVTSPLLENAPGSSNNPETWNRFWVKGQAPAGAAYARMGVQKFGTTSGANSYVFVHKPQFAESHEFAQVPAAYSPDGTTLIDGDSIITGTILARHMTANSITAANAALGVAAVNTLNVAGRAVTAPHAAFVDYISIGGFWINDDAWASFMGVVVDSVGISTYINVSAIIGPFSTDATLIGLRLLRDGNVIAEWKGAIPSNANFASNFRSAHSFTYVDNPPSGNVTYSLQRRKDPTSPFTALAWQVGMHITQFKR